MVFVRILVKKCVAPHYLQTMIGFCGGIVARFLSGVFFVDFGCLRLSCQSVSLTCILIIKCGDWRQHIYGYAESCRSQSNWCNFVCVKPHAEDNVGHHVYGVGDFGGLCGSGCATFICIMKI